MVTNNEVETGKAALQNLTPEQRNRLRAAVRLMMEFLLDNAPLNRKNVNSTYSTSDQATEHRAVQLRLEL